MTDPVLEVDDEFADFVRARQHQLVRAAYLVVGDEQRAEHLVRDAFTTLSVSWRTVRDEDLDAFVRGVLYRAATSRRRPGRDAPVASRPLDPGPWSAAGAALAHLSPRQRAVVVLRHFEQRSEHDTGEALGISAGAVRAQESEARRRLHELAPALFGHPTDARSATDLARVLDAAAEHVLERDVVEAAREGARAHRQRRRRLAAVLAAVVALVVGVAVVPRGREVEDPPAVARTSPPPSAAAQWDPSEVDVLGVPAQVGPSVRQLAELPRIPDLTRNQLALPDVLAFGPDTRIPELSEEGGSGAPVRAVLLRHTNDGFRAVLVRPTLANPYVLVDRLPLVRTLDEGGNTAEPLVVKAVADDRRHVAFLQPRKVVVLDAFTAQLQTFAVPDRHLADGGWVGSDLIVWSQTYRWRISPGTGRVSRVAETVYAGSAQVAVAAPDGLRIHSYDAKGTASASRTGPPLLSGTWGHTFTNDDDQLATGGFLSQRAALTLNRQVPRRLFQGVLTIDAERLTRGRLLVAPESEGVAVGCCEVLGWAYADEVLVRWNVTDLLTWNARTGALLRVSTLPGRQQGTPVSGSAATSVALAP